MTEAVRVVSAAWVGDLVLDLLHSAHTEKACSIDVDCSAVVDAMHTDKGGQEERQLEDDVSFVDIPSNLPSSSLAAASSDPLLLTPSTVIGMRHKLRESRDECDQLKRDLAARSRAMDDLRERYEQERSSIFQELNHLANDSSFVCPSPALPMATSLMDETTEMSHDVSLLEQMDAMVYRNLMDKLQRVDQSEGMQSQMERLQAELNEKTSMLEELRANYEKERSAMLQELNSIAHDNSLVCPSPAPFSGNTGKRDDESQENLEFAQKEMVKKIEMLEVQVEELRCEVFAKNRVLEEMQQSHEQERKTLFQELNNLVNDKSLVCPSPMPPKMSLTPTESQPEMSHDVSLLEQMDALFYKNLMDKLQNIENNQGMKEQIEHLELELKQQHTRNEDLESQLQEAAKAIDHSRRNKEAEAKASSEMLKNAELLKERVDELERCGQNLKSQCKVMKDEGLEKDKRIEELSELNTNLVSKLNNSEKDVSLLKEKVHSLSEQITAASNTNFSLSEELENCKRELEVAQGKNSDEQRKHVESAIAELKEERDALENEVIEMGEKLQDAFAELEESKRSADALSNEIVSLKSSHCLEIIELTENNSHSDAEQKRRLAELNEELGVAKRNETRALHLLKSAEDKILALETLKTKVELSHNDEINALKSLQEHLEKEKQSVQLSLDEKNLHVSSYVDQVSQLKNTEKDLKEKIDVQALELNKLSDQLSTSTKQIEDLRSALEENNSHLTHLKEKLKESESVGEQCNQLQQRIEELDSCLKEEKMKTEAVQKKNEELNVERASAKKLEEQRQEEWEKMASKTAVLEEKVGELQRQKVDSDERQEKLLKNNEELNAQNHSLVTQLEEKKIALQNEMADKTRLASMDEVLKEMEDRYSSRRKILLTTLKNKERDYDKLCSENEELREKVAQLETSLSDARKMQEEIKNELKHQKTLQGNVNQAINDDKKVMDVQKKRLLSSPQKLMTLEKKTRILSPQSTNKSVLSSKKTSVGNAQSSKTNVLNGGSSSLSGLTGAVRKKPTVLLAKKSTSNPFTNSAQKTDLKKDRKVQDEGKENSEQQKAQ